LILLILDRKTENRSRARTIHTHRNIPMTQEVEVGVYAVRKRSECSGWCGQARVSRGAWRLCMCVVFEASWAVVSFLCVVPPAEGCMQSTADF